MGAGKRTCYLLQLAKFQALNHVTWEHLRQEIVIQTRMTWEDMKGSRALLIIDEAQYIYSVLEFWLEFKGGMPVQLICFSVYDFKWNYIMPISPFVFTESYKRGIDFLRFSNHEVVQLSRTLPMVYPQHKNYNLFSETIIEMVYQACGGIPGLVYHLLYEISVNVRGPHAADWQKYAASVEANPSRFLDLVNPSRCFVRLESLSIDPKDPTMRAIFEDLIHQCGIDEKVHEREHLRDGKNLLFRCGIITKEGTFSCPLTALFYRHEFYNHFLSLNPADLNPEPKMLSELIPRALQLFSSSKLLNTRSRGASGRIYERFYQFEFAKAVYSLMAFHRSCDPDVGHVFKSKSKQYSHKIFF